MSKMPTDQVFWYLNCYEPSKKLDGEIITDILIVGGGMAGLHAAQAFNEEGLSVVLIEKNFCGSGATGKSSGFITPDSEYSLSDLIRIYGKDDARKLWELVKFGVDSISANIIKYNLDCDFTAQDTLIVALNKKDYEEDIITEHKNRLNFGYDSFLYDEQSLKLIMGSDKYAGAVRYSNTFGINGYKYCQGLKKVLENLGVQIFEDTPAIEILDNSVKTTYGLVKAKKIIICTDAFTPKLGKLTSEIYHAQTFLMLSQVIDKKISDTIFPKQKYMVWDTSLIYNYFRLTDDNRLMLGGASLFYTYSSSEVHNSKYMASNLSNYFKNKFGVEVPFEYMWPGIIGITKDIMPISGFDTQNKNLYYIAGCAGLPWASALGRYSAQAILYNQNEFDEFFSPNRKFLISGVLQKVLGTKLTFAISNFMRVGSF